MKPFLIPLALTLCAPLAAAQARPKVRLGIETLLAEHVEWIAGKRVGLVTNPAGVDGALVPSVDRLARDERFELVRLFAPEHGIRGEVPAGDEVEGERDPRTGLPVVSLYGATRRPPADSLEGLDVLLFDLQDVGARCYTYLSTLGEAMWACAESGTTLIVLDRPNPLGGLRVAGPVRERAHTSFVGWGPVPLQHGLTAGEMARLYKRELGIDCKLEVAGLEGWTRGMIWEDTGLTWTQTSPHIPSALSAHVYIATAMAASSTTNVSDGVGSTMPFELFGAEFVDSRALLASLNRAGLKGVEFQEIAWQPFYGAFTGRPLRGVRLILRDPRRFEPVRAALTFLVTLRELSPDRVEFADAARVARFWGTEEVLEQVQAGASVAEIEAGWTRGLTGFAAAAERARLYR